MSKFRKGDDYLERGADHKSFGIDVFLKREKTSALWNAEEEDLWHGNQIVVFGDEALRDKILKFLLEDRQ